MPTTKTMIAAGLAALLACTSLAAVADSTSPLTQVGDGATDRPTGGSGGGGTGGGGNDGSDRFNFGLEQRKLPPLCKVVEGGLQIYNNTGETIKKGTVLHIVLKPSGKTIDWTVSKDIPPGAAGVIKNLISPRDEVTSCRFEWSKGREGGTHEGGGDNPGSSSSSSSEPGGGTSNLSSTVGSEAWNSRDLKSRPH